MYRVNSNDHLNQGIWGNERGTIHKYTRNKLSLSEANGIVCSALGGVLIPLPPHNSHPHYLTSS